LAHHEEIMETRQASDRRELAMAMAIGAAMGRITPSRLMSPTELEVATRDRPDLKGKLHGWCLCIEVPDPMWEQALNAYARGRPNQVMVAEAPSGRRYLIVVIQAEEGWQHRVCVPLVGTVTAQWLGALSSRRLMQMSIAKAGSDRTFVAESVVPEGALAQLSSLDTRIPDDLGDFMEEAYRLVVWNAVGNTAGTAAQGTAPKEVSLSLLLPAEVEAHLERRTAEGAERKLS
jgi:hypothetical protein